MSMFGPKMGTWWVHSKSDPRWNKSGRAEGLCCTGGPQEMQDWIDECKRQYGEPPKDAKMGFMKD
ncbi:hypothetical protein ES703_11681 [subsurface metagenome]